MDAACSFTASMYVTAGMCSTIDRYCCSVKRRVSSVRCRSIATPAPRPWLGGRRSPPRTTDVPLVLSSNPRNPHQSGPTKTGTARTLPTPSADRTRRSHSGARPRSRAPRPGGPAPRSIERSRARTGAGGSRDHRRSGRRPRHPIRRGGPSTAVRPDHACSGRGMRETRPQRCRGARAPHRSDRARPRPARSARWRTRRLRGRPLRFRPEPPSDPDIGGASSVL